MTIDFLAVARISEAYNNVFLDSQMNISERMKFAGELGKVLGNFDRLARAIVDIADDLEAAAGPCQCTTCQAGTRLAELAAAYRAARAHEG